MNINMNMNDLFLPLRPSVRKEISTELSFLVFAICAGSVEYTNCISAKG